MYILCMVFMKFLNFSTHFLSSILWAIFASYLLLSSSESYPSAFRYCDNLKTINMKSLMTTFWVLPSPFVALHYKTKKQKQIKHLFI